MSVIETVQLLEQRTQKAASLIAILRGEKVQLQQQLKDAQEKPAVDPALQKKLDEAVAENTSLHAQITSDDQLIAELREKLEEANKALMELQAKFDLVNNHNAELEDYVEKFQTSNKIIEEGINKAMENLNSVQGLDDTPLGGESADELAAADNFTSGGALGDDQVDDDDII